MNRHSLNTPNITEISDALCGAMNRHFPVYSQHHPDILLPSKHVVIEITEILRSIIFPGFFTSELLPPAALSFNTASSVDRVYRKLAEQIKFGFCFLCGKKHDKCSYETCREDAFASAGKFISMLPEIQDALLDDASAAYLGDPAATGIEECIFSYPGVLAVTNYRIAHALHLLHVPIIPRIITEHAHSVTGIDIHPGADIGRHFFIDHGTGVVIGETCIIGNNCRLYQGVTLGAKSFKKDDGGNPVKGIPRHPVLGNDVIVYSGASVLGRIKIGDGAVIGGNVWLTRDVAAGEIIMGGH